MSEPAGKMPMNDEAIEAIASSWLVQRDEGFTSDQAAAFARWQEADPRHAAAVAQLEEAASMLGRMAEFGKDPVLRRELDELRQPSVAGDAKIVRFPRWFAYAGLLAACLVLMAFLVRRDAGEMLAQTYATATGGYQRIVLPDQSVLELNAMSEAQVRFTDTERTVSLARGEAHFTVTKDPAKPFVVQADGVAVRAVGTAFNVRRDVGGVEVLVTGGRVAVSEHLESATGTATSPRGARAGFAPVFANAGQRVRVATAGGADRQPRLVAVDDTTIRNALAWQMPWLVFSETPLSEVVRQFNARNRTQLSIGDPELGGRPVGGKFRADQVEAFVRLLVDSRDIAVERPDADRIVLRKVR